MKALFAIVLILICVDARSQTHPIKTTLAGKTGGNISKEEFNEVGKLEIVSLVNDTTLKVESFRISIAGKGTAYKEFQIKGNQMTHEVDSTINKLHAGNKIFIDVLMTAHGKALRGIPPMEFVLTD